MFACCITRLLTNQPIIGAILLLCYQFFSTCAMCIYEWNIFAWRSRFSDSIFSLLSASSLFHYSRSMLCCFVLHVPTVPECTCIQKLIHFRIIINWKPNQIGTVVHSETYVFLYGNSDKLLSEKANRLHCVQALNRVHRRQWQRCEGGALPNANEKERGNKWEKYFRNR